MAILPSASYAYDVPAQIARVDNPAASSGERRETFREALAVVASGYRARRKRVHAFCRSNDRAIFLG
jgi:hypothetical protein